MSDAAPLSLVTGAGGFIGRHLVAALLARGERVRALDLAFAPPLPAAAEAVTASVTDPDAVAAALAGVSHVFHLAAVTDLWMRDCAAYRRVNVTGTETVLAAARAAGVARLVHVSSYVTRIGGPAGRVATVTEADTLPDSAMLGPYCRSKWESERAVLEAAPALDTVAVLPAAPIGPGDHGPTPPMRFLGDLAAGRLPAVLDCILAFVDVRDVAEALVAARDRGRRGQAYLVTGHSIAMDAFLRLFAAVSGRPVPRRRVPYALALAAAVVEEGGLARLTGRRPAAPLTGVRLAGRRLSFDDARARSVLGYRPRPLETSICDALSFLAGAGP